MRQEMDRRKFLKSTAVAAAGSGVAGAAVAKASANMPMIRIGDLSVSRFIIGGNPFSGHAHQPGHVGREMREWYSVARIKETLNQAADEGVNTFLGRADKHIMRMLQEYWNEGGRVEYWIAQTAPEFASMSRNIGEVKSYGGQAVYIQGSHIDRLFREGRLEEARPWIDMIKEKGMLAGAGSHRPDVLRIIQDQGWPVDFYMQCFYNLTDRSEEYLSEDRDKAVQAIRKLEKPTIAFKILAAGRNDPQEAFPFAFRNIKPGDPVCVGIFQKQRPHEIKQNAELTRRYGT
ncbi:MAG: hypothetical protein DRI92_04310 [Aquificota bacterium]|nr:MAG: hypothetical protein DRI92_04310 [Aquificota bacterium]